MFRGSLVSRGAVLVLLTWVGCTLTTDLPESSVASTASTTAASTSVTAAGSGGAASNCATCTSDCCSNRCSELGCPNCDGQAWPSFCSDPTRLRARCICAATTCEELVDCIVPQCFDNLECASGECNTRTGLCAGTGGGDVASSSSTGGTNDCCGEHDASGCSDNQCENCVCFYEETCCTVTWNALCVNTALDQCASSWCRCR